MRLFLTLWKPGLTLRNKIFNKDHRKKNRRFKTLMNMKLWAVRMFSMIFSISWEQSNCNRLLKKWSSLYKAHCSSIIIINKSTNDELNYSSESTSARHHYFLVITSLFKMSTWFSTAWNTIISVIYLSQDVFPIIFHFQWTCLLFVKNSSALMNMFYFISNYKVSVLINIMVNIQYII